MVAQCQKYATWWTLLSNVMESMSFKATTNYTTSIFRLSFICTNMSAVVNIKQPSGDLQTLHHSVYLPSTHSPLFQSKQASPVKQIKHNWQHKARRTSAPCLPLTHSLLLTHSHSALRSDGWSDGWGGCGWNKQTSERGVRDDGQIEPREEEEHMNQNRWTDDSDVVCSLSAAWRQIL